MNKYTMGKKMFLFFLGIFIIGSVVFFSSQDLIVRYIFAHLGGLGIVGLLACLTGFIAQKKGYSYWRVFLLGFIISIVLGILAVLILESFSCGGSPSLGVALLFLIIYSLLKRRKIQV